MKFLKFCEKTLPLLFWLLVIFAFDTPKFALLTFLSAGIHELGHVFFGLSRGVVRLIPFAHTTGFRIKPSSNLSYKDEIILLIGGPVSNFIFFLLSIFLFLHTGLEVLFDFGFINLLTGISNMLPIKAYDGYRILESVFLMRTADEARTIAALFWLSFGFTLLLCFLSLYFLLKLGEGYWIFALFFSSALVDVKKLGENNIF